MLRQGIPRLLQLARCMSWPICNALPSRLVSLQSMVSQPHQHGLWARGSHRSALEEHSALGGSHGYPSEASGRPYRAGAIAVKVGMTQEWDQWGVRLPLTVLWIDNCEVGVSRDV